MSRRAPGPPSQGRLAAWRSCSRPSDDRRLQLLGPAEDQRNRHPHGARRQISQVVRLLLGSSARSLLAGTCAGSSARCHVGLLRTISSAQPARSHRIRRVVALLVVGVRGDVLARARETRVDPVAPAIDAVTESWIPGSVTRVE